MPHDRLTQRLDIERECTKPQKFHYGVLGHLDNEKRVIWLHPGRPAYALGKTGKGGGKDGR